MLKKLLFLCCCFVWSELPAQDPVFSQFFAAPLQLNPAFAGVTFAPRISFNYRNQWPSWPNAYRTYAASYEQAIENLNSGFGLLLLTDDAGNGIYKTTNFNLAYSYQVRASDELFFKFGIDAGMMQTRLDWDQLIFGDQLDPVGGFENNRSEEDPPAQLNQSDFDVGAGLLIYHTNYYAGVSVKHLNRADERFYEINNNLSSGIPMRVSFHAGAEFSLNRGNNRLGASFISPNVLYIRQGGFSQLNVGAYAGYKSVFGGTWYRHAGNNPDAVIALVGTRYGSFRVAYSFDVTISGLSVLKTGGSHEVSVTINLEDSKTLQQKRKASRNLNCFKMFN